ncbi:MAG: polysaccharide biosynthesis C-terminal domain-containing protein, partial [Candidatus Latescibacterota bacterium]
AIVVTFLQVKILAAYLSKDVFGLFASLRGLTLLAATLAVNGFPQLLIRFFPEFEAKRRRHAAVCLYGFSVVASCALLFISFFIVGKFKATFFDFMPAASLSSQLFFWFWITAIGWMLKLLMYGGLNGMRRLTIHAWLDITSLVVQLAWMFFERHALDLALLFKINGIVSLSEALIGCSVIAVILVRGDRPSGRRGDRPGRSDPAADITRGDDRRRYASYWGWAVGLSVVAIAFTDVDRYLLSQVIALEMLALFHIASRISRLANRLLGVPNFAFQPEVTRLEAEGRGDRTVVSTRVFMKFSAAVSVLIASTLVAFSGEIITIVANASYISAAPLLAIFAISMPLSAMTAPLTSVMKASDRVRGALYCDLAWAATYVCLLLMLGHRFGILGAGFAQLIACASQLYLATRLSRLPMRSRFTVRLSAVLLACAAVSFAPLFILEIISGWATLGMLTLLKTACLVFAVFVFRKMIVVWKVVTREETAILREILNQRGFGRVARFLIGA